MRSLARASLVTVLAAAPLAAQVPLDYVLVAERPPTNTGDALHIVAPLRDHSLRVVPADATWLRALVQSVAEDPAVPGKLYVAGGLSVAVAAPLKEFTFVHERLTAVTQIRMTAALIAMQRIVRYRNSLLMTAKGRAPGLYELPVAGGAATLLAGLADAFDLVVSGQKVWFTSYRANVPSTVMEYDFTTRQSRTIGAYNGVRSLAVLRGQILAGVDNGDLLTIDPVTGQSSLLAQTGKGSLHSVDVVFGGLPVFANDREVWSIADLQNPMYRTTGTISDLLVGGHDVASWLRYGEACPQMAGAATPRFEVTGLPSIGNQGFALGVSGGPANAPALLVAGFDRVRFPGGRLPWPLDSIGMAGCNLYTDIVADAPVVLDAAGAASVPFPVPNLSVLRGGEVSAQWFVRDPAANQAGVSATGGSLSIVR